MKMRSLFSWTGLALCGFYLLLSAWIVCEAQSNNDPKGAFILMGLPVMPLSAALKALVGGSLLYGKSWGVVYLLLMPPTLLLLYALGALAGRSLKWIWRAVRDRR